MTKKDYIKIADAIKENTLYDPNNKQEKPVDIDYKGLVSSLSYIFACDNDKFRRDIFIDYLNN